MHFQVEMPHIAHTLKIKFRLMDKQSSKMNEGHASGGKKAEKKEPHWIVAMTWQQCGTKATNNWPAADNFSNGVSAAHLYGLACRMFLFIFFGISFVFHFGFSWHFCLLSLLNWTICWRANTSREDKLRFVNLYNVCNILVKFWEETRMIFCHEYSFSW